ncbi:MAG: hypothetical protein WC711_03415 [Candidatus Staskawiczbacteria bacterium]|jgi:hypothetical protein
MNKKVIFIIFIIIVLGIGAFLYYKGAIFSKEVLKLDILGPETAQVGEEVEYTVQYKNNGKFILEKPKLIFDLPENSLTEDGKTKFVQNLNDIYPGALEFVKFKGRLLGKDGDLKTAKAVISYTPKNITVRYESETTFITKIDANLITLSFDLPTKIEQGESLQYAINYFSNIDYPLDSLSIKIEPTSEFKIISASPKSLDNMEWKLETLNKAEGGRINISGDVLASAGQPLIFSTSLGRWKNGNFIIIKQVTSQVQVSKPSLSISQRAYYYDSDIQNSGPIPPQVSEPTTYTIGWEINNYFKGVKNVKVRAVLPENINLTGQIAPISQVSKFSFDSISREIVWFAGDIGANADITAPTKFYFQVSLTPNESQKGSVAPLIGVVQISGENEFVDTPITSQYLELDTGSPDDVNSGIVVARPPNPLD